MIAEKLKPATMTLVLTPHLVRNFGASLRHDAASENAWPTAIALYSESLKKNFTLTTRSRSVPEYGERWNRGIVRYSQAYDQILRGFIEVLGPSTFKLAYLKAITEVQNEFDHVSLAIHDLRELNRRHIAYSMNIASNYDAIFESSNSEVLHRLSLLMRSSNFGLTLLFLLLSGEISGPSWVLFATHDRTRESLAEIESSFRLPMDPEQIGGSLKIRQGDLSFLDDIARK
jgi:hypothetical protein